MTGPVPTREEVEELLDSILRDAGGFCLEFLDAEDSDEDDGE
ncbi:hypothetical protein ACFQX6_11490 [Streptosporangium lutulentum]